MKKFLPIVIIVLAVGAGAFYGGTKYQRSKSGGQINFQNFQNMTQEERQTMRQQQGNSGQRIFRNAGENFTAGEIISKDNKSLTIKLPEGGSKIVFFSDQTAIAKSASGAISDLIAGEQITASGAVNQDGFLTAQTIQIRPRQTPLISPPTNQ